MTINDAKFKLKDGREALLRAPLEEEAAELLKFITKASGETDYLLTRPEVWEKMTVEQEAAFIRETRLSQSELMLTCFVDGMIVGNCQISFLTGIKTRHRASVAISVLQEYWSLGIGTRMFEEMFKAARSRPSVRQIELDFIEGNVRARALYEKMGFRITGVKPDAIQTSSGALVNEYMMLKRL